MSEQLGAVDDGNVFRPRHGEIRYLGLHRRREHESGAVLGDAAPVLGHDFDAETFELHAAGRTYAIREYLCVPHDSADGATAATLRPGDDAAEAIWAGEEDLLRLGVSEEARGVIGRAVAVLHDRKELP